MISQTGFQLSKAASRTLTLGFGAGVALLLWSVVWDLRPYPVDGWVDDTYYIHNAFNIASLKWLGPYSELTLMKRPLYSAVLAVSYLLHIPYSLYLYTLVFCSAAALSLSLRKIGIARGLCAACFVSLVFLPTFNDREALRLIRDPIFVCIQLFALAAAIRFFGTPRTVENGSARRRMLLLALALLALHAGMREEAAVFYPGLVVMLIYDAAAQTQLPWKARWIYGLKLLLAGIVAVQGALTAVRTLNLAYYGQFILNEHEEGPFPEAMAAVASVRDPGSTSRALIGAAERSHLNALSPLFRKISAPLDAAGEETPPDCPDPHRCDNLDYSHAIFYIRVFGLPGAGVTGSAADAAGFYRGLRGEIEELCASKRIPCESPLRRSMQPPLRMYHLPYVYEALNTHAGYLLHFAHRGFSPDYPEPSPSIVREVERITHQRYFTVGPDNRMLGHPPASFAVIQSQAIRRSGIARMYSGAGPYVIGAALAAFLTRLLAIPFAGVSLRLALSAGVLILVVARLAAIVYISAVDKLMGMNYSVPGYSLLVVFCALSFASLSDLASRRARP